ncbi:MAG: hypothetical protein AB8G18_02855, partial [Gammaproteobacteria bacterium]
GFTMITHHFNDENDYKQGGRFAGDYGSTLCEWTWEADSRVIDVRCGSEGHRKDLSQFDPAWLADVELKKRLPDVAREIAEDILGRELG